MKKTQITSGLRGGSALSALVLASALFAAPAFAQDATTTAPATAAQADDAEPEGDIVVTGSLFRRTNAETPSPVTVLSAATLEQRGINTVAEAVQRVSAGGAGNITQGWNTGSNFASGANAVSLRGLTVQSTLTIFDGLRMAPYPLADDGHRNFVDLNTIPNAIIERIEILRDGASSTYGADAVAGVVNVITKKQVTGIHANASAGISQWGDAGEQRVDLTLGFGDLDEQGFNFYVNGEYQRSDALWARDRGYPFNTSDLSGICGPSGACMLNGITNGISKNGAFNGLGTTTVPVVRPVDAAGVGLVGTTFNLLNTAAGCRDLTSVIAPPSAAVSSRGSLQCQQDLRAQYSQLLPDQERLGFAARFTANIGDRAQMYAAANYYNVHTYTQLAPATLQGSTAAPGGVTYNPVFLPVYVCSTGVGTLTGLGTGCTAANGNLNPNNPYAAAGNRAQLLWRYDKPRTVETSARTLRVAAGINGSFGDDWNYNVEATASTVRLRRDSENYLIPQRIMDVLARGTLNLVNPSANTQAVRDYIAPKNSNISDSDLWQVNATLSKALFELPGGPLQAAVGVSYREEGINNPSANPANDAAPYTRYYSINAVGAIGRRNVKSAFFEVNAPIIPQFEVNASGRYDDYSSGQTNFSPKIGAKFTPVKELAIRGTYSKGFRIPSFNEAYGLPTTGYVTYTLNPGIAAEAAFIAAHGGNSYGTGGFSVGLTSTGNPNLAPEKSTSWTVGAIFEPIRNVSFTVDYWNIKVDDIIGGADYSDVRRQYYANNGVVNVPGIVVRPGIADINFPAALPHLGFIEYSFQNNDSQQVSGIDLGANIRLPLGGVTLSSNFEASYLMKFEKTIGGVVQRYDGTLSPCDVTSCSGAPKWRASWQNTLEIGDFTVSGTAYYTSGYDLASIDYGGVKDQCSGATLGSSVSTYTDGTPVLCDAKATWNVDLSASYRVSDNLTVYTNVLNALNIKPPFDPSAAYHIFQFNPSWAGANILGRYIRVGAKVNF